MFVKGGRRGASRSITRPSVQLSDYWARLSLRIAEIETDRFKNVVPVILYSRTFCVQFYGTIWFFRLFSQSE